MLIFCLSFLVGLLYDFQILHIDEQIFQLGSHDVVKNSGLLRTLIGDSIIDFRTVSDFLKSSHN